MREPEEIRRYCARKLEAVEVSDHFRAILGCLLVENWTTPRLVEMVITPGRAHARPMRGRGVVQGIPLSIGRPRGKVHGVAPVADLDGDETGYLVAKIAEIKRQK